jgi:hypothetical protein
MLKPGPKGAIPTLRGWVHPQTGELLKSQRITQEQLNEWNGMQMLAEPAPVVEPEVVKVKSTPEVPEVTMDEVIDREDGEGDEVELIVDTVQTEIAKPKKKKKKKRTLFG